eukprot:8935707-Alexandrium_andersonii.AAC.1
MDLRPRRSPEPQVAQRPKASLPTEPKLPQKRAMRGNGSGPMTSGAALAPPGAKLPSATHELATCCAPWSCAASARACLRMRTPWN